MVKLYLFLLKCLDYIQITQVQSKCYAALSYSIHSVKKLTYYFVITEEHISFCNNVKYYLITLNCLLLVL